jgi:serine/threonine protein kinase
MESKNGVLSAEVQADDLEIQERVAEGTFGIVYKAKWLSAVVAVKKMRTPVSNISRSDEVMCVCECTRISMNLYLYIYTRRYEVDIRAWLLLSRRLQCQSRKSKPWLQTTKEKWIN